MNLIECDSRKSQGVLYCNVSTLFTLLYALSMSFFNIIWINEINIMFYGLVCRGRLRGVSIYVQENLDLS